MTLFKTGDRKILSPVEGGMADVAAGDEVNHVFGDIDGVVADALEILGDENELERGEDDGGIFHHIGKELAEELVAQAIHLIVALHDAAGEFLVAADQGVEAIAHHAFGKLAHAREIHVGLHLRMAQHAHGGLGDIDGLVADALEIAIDARDGEEKAQVGGHGLLEREEALDAFVNFNLHFIDGVFFVEDGFGEGFFGVEDGVDGLMDGALGEAAHPEKALLQFFEIVFKMAFHGSDSFRRRRAVRPQAMRANAKTRAGETPALQNQEQTLRRAEVALLRVTIPFGLSSEAAGDVGFRARIGGRRK